MVATAATEAATEGTATEVVVVPSDSLQKHETRTLTKAQAEVFNDASELLDEAGKASDEPDEPAEEVLTVEELLDLLERLINRDKEYRMEQVHNEPGMDDDLVALKLDTMNDNEKDEREDEEKIQLDNLMANLMKDVLDRANEMVAMRGWMRSLILNLVENMGVSRQIKSTKILLKGGENPPPKRSTQLVSKRKREMMDALMMDEKEDRMGGMAPKKRKMTEDVPLEMEVDTVDIFSRMMKRSKIDGIENKPPMRMMKRGKRGPNPKLKPTKGTITNFINKMTKLKVV